MEVAGRDWILVRMRSSVGPRRSSILLRSRGGGLSRGEGGGAGRLDSGAGLAPLLGGSRLGRGCLGGSCLGGLILPANRATDAATYIDRLAELHGLVRPASSGLEEPERLFAEGEAPISVVPEGNDAGSSHLLGWERTAVPQVRQ